MKRKHRLQALTAAAAVLCGSMQTTPVTASAAAEIDYAKALQMSLFFYECQQAGELPQWNRVEWRGDATAEDDLNGGWYDAGDHVKFNLPMSYSAAMLAWGLYQYPEGVEACGEMTNYVNNLKWVLDYLAACDLGDSVIYQVGNGQHDHSWWGSVELLEYGMLDQGVTEPRGHLEGRNCSAVTAEMGAALAAGYCALQGKIDAAVLDDYLAHAKNYFTMADADQSDATYEDSDAANFYRSSHFYDELFWCANWLYIATGDAAYLDKATSYIPDLGKELGSDEYKYSWAQCWDDVQQGGTLLYALNTGDATWKEQVRKHLEYWEGSKSKLPDGAVYVDGWGCLRYANGVGWIVAVAADTLFANDAKHETYRTLAETQINYCLGDNPDGRAYAVGYNDTAPLNPHHRTAHGSSNNSFYDPEQSRHILYGALVGGPTQGGEYVDDRNNYINNEVATDYNAAYTALLCRMVTEYGGKSDPAFPYPEVRDDELFVEAKHKADASCSTISLKMTNKTAWPARVVDDLSMRYFVDLSEVIDAGFSASDVTIRCDRNQSEMYSGKGYAPATVSSMQHYKDNIYYVEVNFPDGRVVLPISEGQYQCEILLALVYPNYGSGWDASNDYSAQGLNGEENIKTEYVTVYEGDTLIFGTEPDGTTGKGSISANPAPGGKPITTTPSQTTETTQPDAPTVNYGDVDCDGKVKINDVVLLSRFISEDIEAVVTDQGIVNAQCYNDGDINGNDATLLLQYLAGMVSYDVLGAPIQ